MSYLYTIFTIPTLSRKNEYYRCRRRRYYLELSCYHLPSLPFEAFLIKGRQPRSALCIQ